MPAIYPAIFALVSVMPRAARCHPRNEIAVKQFPCRPGIHGASIF